MALETSLMGGVNAFNSGIEGAIGNLQAAEKQKTLGLLGQKLQTGDYDGAAQAAFQSGDPGTGLKILELKQTKAQDSANMSALGTWGGGVAQPTTAPAAAPAGAPMALLGSAVVPNDSNAIPGTVGLNQTFADRLSDFQQDNPNIRVNSAYRSPARQAELYANRGNNPYPVAAPGTSLHEKGMAVDLGGLTPADREMAKQYGIAFPVTGDPVHAQPVETAGGVAPPGVTAQRGSQYVSAASATMSDASEGDPAPKPKAGAGDDSKKLAIRQRIEEGQQKLLLPGLKDGQRAFINARLATLQKDLADLDKEKFTTVDRSEYAANGIDPNYRGVVQRNINGQITFPGKAATEVNIDQKGEGEEAKAAGKAAGERRAGMFASAGAASKTLQNLARTESLLDQVAQGKLEPTKMTVSAWAKALGVNDDVAASIGLDPKGVGSAQALQALANESVLSRLGSGGFPANNFSNSDREFLVDMFPKLGSDPRGNKIMVEGARRMANLDMQRARDYQKFKADPANKGKGFEDFELDFSEKVAKQDLFGDLRKQAEAIVGGPRTDIGRTMINPGAAPRQGPQPAQDWQDLGGGVRIRERR